jgi:hypothetical protein
VGLAESAASSRQSQRSQLPQRNHLLRGRRPGYNSRNDQRRGGLERPKLDQQREPASRQLPEHDHLRGGRRRWHGPVYQHQRGGVEQAEHPHHGATHGRQLFFDELLLRSESIRRSLCYVQPRVDRLAPACFEFRLRRDHLPQRRKLRQSVQPRRRHHRGWITCAGVPPGDLLVSPRYRNSSDQRVLHVD